MARGLCLDIYAGVFMKVSASDLLCVRGDRRNGGMATGGKVLVRSSVVCAEQPTPPTFA